MILFEIGTAQVKLQATPAASQYPGGAVKEATGLRVFTFFYPDEAALTSRFAAKGYPAPSFTARAAGGRAAMVLDPEKQWVELVVLPGASAETYRRFEAGITASNIETSRAFYRSFVGLEELAPIADPVLGTTRYPFRHGDTTINVWSFGEAVPANKSSAGIQYVVSNVEAVDAKAKAAAVTIDRPLGPFGQGLRTIWLSDPDGVPTTSRRSCGASRRPYPPRDSSRAVYRPPFRSSWPGALRRASRRAPARRFPWTVRRCRDCPPRASHRGAWRCPAAIAEPPSSRARPAD